MREIRVINLTPHVVNLLRGHALVAAFPPSGVVARVEVLATSPREVGDYFPTVKLTYGQVEGLPGPVAGTIYIVSAMVLDALRKKGVKRADVLAPDTGPESAVRDAEGRIIGIKRFIRL